MACAAIILCLGVAAWPTTLGSLNHDPMVGLRIGEASVPGPGDLYQDMDLMINDAEDYYQCPTLHGHDEVLPPSDQEQDGSDCPEGDFPV